MDEKKKVVGQIFTLKVKSFTFLGQWSTLVCQGEKGNIRAIIGKVKHFGMKDMMLTKGMTAELSYQGPKEVNGNIYDRYFLEGLTAPD
jgi:hypothetical protein